jgi:hypothetical protein
VFVSYGWTYGLARVNVNEVPLYYPMFIKSILILFYHLRLGLSSVFVSRLVDGVTLFYIVPSSFLIWLLADHMKVQCVNSRVQRRFVAR